MELVEELIRFCHRNLVAFYRRVEAGNGWGNAESWRLTRFYRSADNALQDAGGAEPRRFWMAGHNPRIEDVWPTVRELASLASSGRLDALEGLSKLSMQSARMLQSLDRLEYIQQNPLPKAADWNSKKLQLGDEEIKDTHVNSMLRDLEERIARNGDGPQEQEGLSV
jgi:hypothetical protein